MKIIYCNFNRKRMKNILILATALLLFGSTDAFAQPKAVKARSIISAGSSIRTYNERKALEGMLKGELIELYKERVRILINILPNIALASKPGISLVDIGVPDTNENKKALEDHQLAANTFLTETVQFQTNMLAFSDKVNLINCILFYENVLKQLNVLNDTE